MSIRDRNRHIRSRNHKRLSDINFSSKEFIEPPIIAMELIKEVHDAVTLNNTISNIDRTKMGKVFNRFISELSEKIASHEKIDRIEELNKLKGLVFKELNINSKSNSEKILDLLLDSQFTASDIKNSLKRMGSEQKKLLIKIAIASDNGKQKVRFAPSQWFAGEKITTSKRATWSRCKKGLVKKGLILIEYQHQNILCKDNPGNSIAYVSLTALGCLAAKWLINCDS